MLAGKQIMVTGLINITALMKRLSGVTIALCLLFAMQPAQASLILDDSLLGTEILGGSLIVAEDGKEVTATFLGSDAGYFNTLYLSSPRVSVDPLFIFDRDGIFDQDGERIYHEDGEPTTISLGSSFGAGEELIFSLYVKNTGNTFYTGDSSRNPDDLAHASAITSLVDGLYVTKVGFEDLYGGGDKDYNDFMFSLTNVVDPPAAPVPEPSILLLLSGVLFSMIIFLRQRRFRTH